MAHPPVEQACPVVLSRKDDRLTILAFRHPLAGLQLVKGTIEPGETPAEAACRELTEESGLNAARAPTFLFATEMPEDATCWHVYLCEVEATPGERWHFATEDDGGQVFAFFWQDLEADLSEDWHPVFRAVLDLLRQHLKAHPDVIR